LAPSRFVVWTLGACAAGLAVTVLAATHVVRFAYRNFTAHVVLDTASSCVAIVVAYLIYGRLQRAHRLQDYLLLQGLVLLGLADVGPILLDALAVDTRAGTLDVWFPLTTRVIALIFVAVASLTRRGRSVDPAWTRGAVVPAALILGALFIALGSAAGSLPLAVDPDASPSNVEGGLAAGHPLVSTGLLISAACLAIATVGFTRGAVRSADEMQLWIAAGCALAFFARINYLIFPSVYSRWLYAGDVLRSGFYLILLTGAAREVRQHWSAQVEQAVSADRRRLARELHDGVLQELSYIRHEVGRLSELDAQRTDRVVASCDRAMDETRQAVEALGARADEPLGHAIHRAVRQVADRHGVRLEADLDRSVAVDLQQRHALLRIAREAVSNAARHGGASLISVFLRNEGADRVLRVSDDGRGFDVAETLRAARGFGLTAMQERARELPAVLDVVSSPEDGTTVEVRW
jgi:signal transduction histidine kinase